MMSEAECRYEETRMVEKLTNLKKKNNVDWSKYSASFGNAELMLGYYYNVLHFHRDIRGDEGDDVFK